MSLTGRFLGNPMIKAGEKMKRICSWCNQEMNSGAEGLFSPDKNIITHGICEACAAEVLADLEEFDLMVPQSLPREFALVDTYTGTDPRLTAFASTAARMIKLPR